VASEICKDCGEGAIGTKIELAGKCVLIAYALPLIGEVLEFASSFAI
jgi:stage III sporulation protein AD